MRVARQLNELRQKRALLTQWTQRKRAELEKLRAEIKRSEEPAAGMVSGTCEESEGTEEQALREALVSRLGAARSSGGILTASACSRS